MSKIISYRKTKIDFTKFITEVIGTTNTTGPTFSQTISSFIHKLTKNLTQSNSKNENSIDIFEIFKSHTKDFEEFSLILLTERKFWIHLVIILSKNLQNFQTNFMLKPKNCNKTPKSWGKNTKISWEESKFVNKEENDEDIYQLREQLKNLEKSNSKLLYENFLKDMRNFGHHRKNNQLSRQRSQKFDDSKTLKSHIRRWDSLSKMIVKLSKSCGRETPSEENTTQSKPKPSVLYWKRKDINSFSFNSKLEGNKYVWIFKMLNILGNPEENALRKSW